MDRTSKPPSDRKQSGDMTGGVGLYMPTNASTLRGPGQRQKGSTSLQASDGLQGVLSGWFAGLWSLLPGPHAACGYHFHPLGINVLQSSQPFSGLSDEAPDKHYSQSMHFQSG